MKQTIYLVGILLSLFSCKQPVDEKLDSYFTRDDLQVLPLSNPEKVLLEDTFNDPAAYWLIQDSLVLVQNNPHSDYMIEIFSLNTRKRILGLATRGNGPGEFGNCLCLVPSSQSPVFYIKDVERFQFYTVDMTFVR